MHFSCFFLLRMLIVCGKVRNSRLRCLLPFGEIVSLYTVLPPRGKVFASPFAPRKVMCPMGLVCCADVSGDRAFPRFLFPQLQSSYT